MHVTRIIATRFIPATATKGSRVKAFAAGQAPQTYGYHSFEGGGDSDEYAAETAARAWWPDASLCNLRPTANPTGGRDRLWIVTLIDSRPLNLAPGF